MKKLFIVSVLLITISISCCDLQKSLDNSRCMETVENAYPKAFVYALPDEKYRFIVIDTSNTIMYVRVLGAYNKISSVNVIKHNN